MKCLARPASPSRSVLIVSGEFPPKTGGIGVYAFEIAKHLGAAGWDVHVAAAQGTSEERQTAAFNATTEFSIDTLPTHRPGRCVSTLIRGRSFGVIVAADLQGLLWSWLPVRFLRRRVPLVTLGHGSEFVRGSRIAIACKKILYRNCDHVVFNSRFTEASALARGYRVPRSSIIHPAGGEVRPTGDHTRSRLRDRLNLAGRRTFLTVGTVSRRKGQTAVIAAMPEVARRIPDAHYLIVGRESDGGEARRLVDELNLTDRVTFAGPLSDDEKTAAYDLSEFTVLPSRNLPDEIEGFGIVVLEAAACGRTTIGTAETGVAEAIQDGRTGLLVQPNSSAALADAILRLLLDQSLRNRLSEAARDDAAERTWRACALSWGQLLYSLVEHPASAERP